MGAVTPLGNSAEESWKGACAGKSGIGLITKFDTTVFDTKIAGEVKAFDPLQYVNKKEYRRLDDFIVYALAAADMAVQDAGHTRIAGERSGVIIGSAIGGLATIEKEKETILHAGPRRVATFMIPAVLANLGAGHVSIRYGLKGPITCPTTACAAGTNAIGDAFRMIRDGYADLMITGGVEAAVTPLAVAGFNAMRALSTKNDVPEKASRPFDRKRDGFVIGEGCGLLILEELSAALKRDAKIYGEVIGYGLTSDAYHLAAPPPGHEGAVRCMKEALADGRIAPEEVDYINAHGTSTLLNDLYEAQAIKTVFGATNPGIAVSSTKSMTGHMLGAAGGVEAIFTVKALQEGIMPPTINLDEPDPENDLDYVPHRARQKDMRFALSNTFGFGGVNASLVLKKYTG
ncbi:MAG: beta-ketoacyl-ACP synthase II [Syntrophales bacterium]|jgi:3-oxoacyl-[acyl-carrier-protein] synthase II|nr:beta-ketoacyl-ACP synthase II [Syntrophales bacterium]